MKIRTTAAAIEAKINSLPLDYVDHVVISSPGKAEVVSFSNPSQSHHVEIKKEGDELLVECSCPATDLCKHVIAYYAVAKKIKPVPPIIEELEKKRTQVRGYDLIAKAIEDLTNGIALIIEEKLRK